MVEIFVAVCDVLVVHDTGQAHAQHVVGIGGKLGVDAGQGAREFGALRIAASGDRRRSGFRLLEDRSLRRSNRVEAGGEGAQAGVDTDTRCTDRRLELLARERQRAGGGEGPEQRGGDHAAALFGEHLHVGAEERARRGRARRPSRCVGSAIPSPGLAFSVTE